MPCIVTHRSLSPHADAATSSCMYKLYAHTATLDLMSFVLLFNDRKAMLPYSDDISTQCPGCYSKYLMTAATTDQPHVDGE